MSLEFFEFSTILTHWESKQMRFEIHILLVFSSINAMHPVPISVASSSIEQFKLSSLVQTLLLEYQIHFPPILICLKYTPQNNCRTNTFNYSSDAFCVERIMKTNFTI